MPSPLILDDNVESIVPGSVVDKKYFDIEPRKAARNAREDFAARAFGVERKHEYEQPRLTLVVFPSKTVDGCYGPVAAIGGAEPSVQWA